MERATSSCGKQTFTLEIYAWKWESGGHSATQVLTLVGGPSIVQWRAAGARGDTAPEGDGELGHRLDSMQKSTEAKPGLLARGAGTAGEPLGKRTRKYSKLVTWT